ncbi:hypothetical protein AB7X03_17390 [Providencia rettgeri]
MAQTIIEFLENIANGLSSYSVSAGFVNGATYPDGTSVAEVAAKNEYGDPLNNQLPRPFFSNAISEKSDDWKRLLLDGLRSGHPLPDTLEIVGDTVAADVRQSINDLWDPPLSQLTLSLRRVRGNNSNKPLLDTRWMYDNVTYSVSNGGSV